MKADARIAYQGTTYAVERHGVGQTSRTEVLEITITNQDTGLRTVYNVIRKYRQSKSTGRTHVNVNLVGAPKGTPGWKGLDLAYAALVELTAQSEQRQVAAA